MGRYSFLHDDDHDQDDDGDDHGHDDDDHDNNDRKLDSVNNDPMAVDHHADYADYADDADADYADESYDQQYHHQRHQKQHHHQQHNNQQQHEEDYEYHRWRRCQERGGGGGHDHGHGHEEERYQRRRRQQYGEQQQTDMNGRNWQIVELRRRPNGHGVHGGHDPYPPQDDTGVVSEDDDDENNDEPEEGEILEYNDRQRRRRSMSSSRRRRRGGGGWGNDVVIGGGDIHYHIHIDGREVLRRRRTSPSTNGNDGDDQHHFNDLQPVLVAGGGRIHRNNTFNGDMVGSALDEPNDGHHHHHRPRYYSHSWQSICHTLLAVVAVTTHICYWYGDRQHHTHTSSSSSSSSSQFLLPTSWSYQNLWPSTTSLSVWKLFELTKSTPNFFHQQYTSNSGEPYWVFPSQWNLLDVQTNDDDDDQHDQTISSKKITIFGQDLALKIAQDRLNNNQEEDQTAVVSQTNTILYLTGGGGTSSVGKTLLVYKLLEQITLSLPPPSLVRWRLPWWWSSSSSSSSSWDYSSLKDKNAFDICQNEWNHQIVSTSTQNDNDEQNDDLPSLCPLIRMSPSDAKARDLNLIGNQLRSKYSSMILLMERVDEWNDSELMETLNKILDANHDQHTTSSRRRLVVVMTSNVGSNAQEKWIRKYLQQNVQQHHRSSTNSVADGSDIDSTTSAEPLSSSSLPSTTSISRSVVNKELIPLLKQVIQEFHGVSMMNGLTIIPFNVLDRNAIRSILLDYINISSTFLPFSFQVTASGLDRLLDDHLEWHQWIHKSSGQILRKWSPSGASQVTELWNSHMAVSLLQQYQRQSGSDTNSGCIARAESTGGVTDNGTKALTTILDVDEGSTDRFALRSCYLMATCDGDNPNNVDEEKPFIKATSKITDNNTCHGRTIHVMAMKTRNKSISRTGDSRYRENEDEEEEMYCCPVDRLPCRFYL